jgi:hypothetical protein
VENLVGMKKNYLSGYSSYPTAIGGNIRPA